MQALGTIIDRLYRYPARTLCILALFVLAALGAAVMALTVKGDVAEVLSGNSETYARYEAFDARFAHPSEDEVLLVTADDLGAAPTFAALEELVIELQFTEGASAVLSLFSVPARDNAGVPFLSRLDVQALSPAERLDLLAAQSPFAGQLLNAERSATLVTVISDVTVPEDVRRAALAEAIDRRDPALDVGLVGLAELQREVSAALIADQLVLTPLSTLVCFVLALALFRAWRAALICVVPGLVGTAWWFGAVAALGVPLTPLMAIVPTVLAVLALADSVHVYHAVLRSRDGRAPGAAIVRGFVEVAPAILLTSVTTAVAFLCLLVVGSPTLADLAMVAPLGLALTTLAVFLVLPAALGLVLRHETRPAPGLPFAPVGRAAGRLLSRARWIAPLALAGTVLAGGAVAVWSETGYRMMDHVPRNSEYRTRLTEVETVLPGSGAIYAVIAAADPAPGLSPADRDRLRQAAEALFGDGATGWAEIDEDSLDNPAARRVVAADGSGFALPVPVPLGSDWRQIRAEVTGIETRLAQAGLAEVSYVTGYTVMSSLELPVVVAELRTGFYVAIAMIFVLIWWLIGSGRLALVALIPNVLPILGVELWLILSGTPVTIVGAIALTVAFGIAVDDTIHLLNRLRLARARGAPVSASTMADALHEAAPPIVTTSAILVVGFVTTYLSQLPSIAIFGQLVAVAILLALLADLFLFPSLIVWAGKSKDTR